MNRGTLARARRHLIRRDPILAELIGVVGPCRWGEGQTDLFAGIIRAIVSQQLSVKAADTIFGRVQQLLPNQQLDPHALAAVSSAALRAAGMSARKCEFVLDVSSRFARGELRADDLAAMSDEQVVAALTSLRGVGQWTAEMILIFRLHRPDILPLDDVGLMRAVQRAYRLRRRPTPRQLTRIAEAWRPWRSVACWYLWASLDA
jgi:DNA-3-methyladenine glycosylase II